MRQTDARLTCCICITSEMEQVYMYTSPSDITLVDSARNKEHEWAGWEHFNKALSPEEMVKLAINLGIRLEFKRGTKEDLSQELWMELCYRADDRRSARAPITRDPLTGKKRGRKKSDLGSRRYIIIGVPDKVKAPPDKDGKGFEKLKKDLLFDAPMTTRQAKKVWEFFIDEWLSTGSNVVLESRMQDIVNDRAEELRTKQDPWRIFCYYRPELIDCQLIRLEK